MGWLYNDKSFLFIYHDNKVEMTAGTTKPCGVGFNDTQCKGKL